MRKETGGRGWGPVGGAGEVPKVDNSVSASVYVQRLSVLRTLAKSQICFLNVNLPLK